MTYTADDVVAMLKRILGTYQKLPVQILLCTVVSVDEDEKTCVVDPVDDNSNVKIEGVKLSVNANDGFCEFPAVDSNVLVAVTQTKAAYVIKCEDVDKIKITIDKDNYLEYDSNGWVFNNGTLGGLIKITDLTTEINNRVNILKAASVAGFTSVDAALNSIASGSGVSTAAYNGAVATLTPLNKSTYENTKIKH
jgi:hypothetical protein